MDSTMLITIWLMTGAFIGGVVTPVLAANRAVNLGDVGGMSGMIGNGAAGAGGLPVARRLDDHRPAWQRRDHAGGRARAPPRAAGTAGEQSSR